MTADALRDRIAEALVDAAHDQYPEGMRPGDNDDCGCPWGIGEIDWLGFADAVLAALADADPTDLGCEQVGWQLPEGGLHDDEWVPHVEHDLCTRVYAHPRPEEAHTVDVGHVHVLAEPGGSCAPGCPHPDHRTEETPDGR